MVNTSISPRRKLLNAPVPPTVVLVAGPAGIQKSRTIARWCIELQAEHLSPKAEMYKQYIKAKGGLGAVRRSPRQRADPEFEAFKTWRTRNDRWAFDYAIRTQIRTFGDTIIFVDVADCTHARYYSDFHPVLIYIDNERAAQAMSIEAQCELDLLRAAAYRVVASTDDFPVKPVTLRAYASLHMPLFPAPHGEKLHRARSTSVLICHNIPAVL